MKLWVVDALQQKVAATLLLGLRLLVAAVCSAIAVGAAALQVALESVGDRRARES